MHEWNILVTSLMGQRSDLAKVLKNLGEFKATGYRDVMLGRVKSTEAFLENLRDLIVNSQVLGRMLGRAIPFDKTFLFAKPEELTAKLFDSVSDYAMQLNGKRFYVRMERRGFKGKISSPDVERAIDQFIQKTVSETGGEAKVDFEDPDAIIVIETVSNLVGVSLLPKELREKYPFVRVE